MKKIILALALTLFITGAYAQFSFNTNTNIGQTYKNIKTVDKDTFIVDFSTTKANSTWAYTTAPAYAITFQKCQTQKGLQVKGFLDAASTTEYKIGTTDCNNWGSNRNPIHVASIDSLKSILIKSPGAASGGSVSDSITRPAACLIDVAGNTAFGLYPGKVKHMEYWFQYNFAGKSVQDDLQFDISTLDAGTTGKTATYSLSVSTVTEANVIFTKTDFYVTGSGTKTIKLAETMGVNPSIFSDKKVYIKINTLGTSNASNVVDGIAHGVDASNVPIAYDPMIVFDNFFVTFITPQWVTPVAIANETKDNSTAPVVKGTVGTQSQFGLNLKTKGRIGTFAIIYDDPSTIGFNPGSRLFTFLETGAIKGNDGSGNYTVDIPYTYVAPAWNDGTSTWTKPSYTIAAPSSGSVDDDIMVYVNATPNSTTVAQYDKLELNPGVRIWYNLYVMAGSYTALDAQKSNSIQAYSANGKLFVMNATSDVVVTNLAGQTVKVVNLKNANQGVNLPKGIYFATTNKSDVTKVIVQ